MRVNMESEVAAGGSRREVERLCRLCATITTHPNQRVDIFAVDGLRCKIETCLPVRVTQDSLLPDTLCAQCNDKICSFFAFRKRSLETLKILEENFHVTQSCFTSPRSPLAVAAPLAVVKFEKGTLTDNLHAERTQFEDWRNKKLANFHYEDEDFASKQEHRRKLLSCALEMEKAEKILEYVACGKREDRLVEYDSSDGEPDGKADGKENRGELAPKTTYRNKLYFDDKVNDIISEICERKSTKRKLEQVLGNAAAHDARCAKAAKPNLSTLFPGGGGDSSSRRKKRPPARRVQLQQPQLQQPLQAPSIVKSAPSLPGLGLQSVAKQLEQLPQVCLLCDQQFAKGTLLAAHVFDTHGIDMAQVLSSEPIPEGMTRTLHANLQHLQQSMTMGVGVGVHAAGAQASDAPASPGRAAVASGAEKKKKLPELVKIADLKTKRESIELKVPDDAPPTLTASYVCPLCPASLTNKTDLYAHLRVRHAQYAKLICGLCMHIATSLHALQEHLDACAKSHAVLGYFVCQVCKYAEDNQKALENHILVHDFLLADCKKDGKIFDPSDFMETNEACEAKFYSCTECGSSLQSFKEYSSHKRSEHSIFHCDLCNKSYGRNSHLWKHVNRVHKGHPSVTCQFCYKTSASKYHLLQHFNKIHTQKAGSLSLSLGAPMTSSSSSSNAAKVKNGEVLSELEEDDFMTKKFDPFDFQSVRQSFMRAELEAKKAGAQPSDASAADSPRKISRHPEMRDLSALKMPSVPPKELDSSSTIYTNIITNYTPPTNDGEYKCPKCAKAFHKRTLLKKHKKNCRPRLQKDLLTRCKSCSRIFKDRQSLAKHLVNYHSEYSCEMCDEKVQSKCEIVSHIRFTHPESHLICCDCGNVLRNNDLLRAHLQDHANSFVCQFCGDVLPSKIKLKMHILSLHRKILSLSCGVCLKLFESQHVLRDHVRMVHREALQPLTSCTVCGKNYGSKWKTYDHLNKSHGRVFRACKVCLEVFNNEVELQAHVDMHHSKGMKKYVPADNLPPFEHKDSPMSGELDDDSEPEDEVRIKDEFEGKSILEKHLVGAYAHRNNNSQQVKQNGLTMSPVPSSVVTTPKGAAKHHSDEMINSSKRTVYVNSNDPSVCDICHKNWPAKKHLWQHYIRCHKQVAATVCGICLSTNKTYADLQRHLNAVHPTLLHGRGFGSNFICRICGRYHNASSKLKLHMAIHIKFDWALLDEPQSNAPSAQPRELDVKQEVHEMDQDNDHYGEEEDEDGEEEDDDDDDVDEDDEDDDEDDDDEGEEEDVLEHEQVAQQEQQGQQIKLKVKIKPPPKNALEANDDVNFESMIEQVECSTNSSSSSESEGEAEGEGVAEVNDDEGEEDEDEDDDDDEGEEDDDQNASQVEEEDEQEIEELSDEENDQDDGEEGDEEDDDLQEVPEIKVEPQASEDSARKNHHVQYEEEALDDDENDDGTYQEDAGESDEGEEEFEEVVEEVVHQDDHITIYEQEEIVEEEAYIHSDVELVDEEGEEGQIVIKHIQAQDDLDDGDEAMEEEEEEEEDGGDEDEEEEEDGSTSSLPQEIIYEPNQVAYVQEDGDEEGEALDVDSAVQSICYEEGDSCHDGNVAEEYEVQSVNAPGLNNQHEIQSAVDSIL